MVMHARAAALVAAVLLFSACGDGPQEPFDCGIEGRWSALVPDKPDWKYHFDQGLLTQTTSFAGVPLSIKQYPYTLRGDTVIIGGDTVDAPRRWVLRFECCDVVELQHLAGPLATPRWLRRLD
jgi:hypothetical protein